jgi:hypothetical protein
METKIKIASKSFAKLTHYDSQKKPRQKLKAMTTMSD